MKVGKILAGIVAFAIVRPLIIELATGFGAIGPGLSALPQQAFAGLISGVIAVPVSFLVFERKWPRIICCSLLGTLYGVGLAVVIGVSHQLQTKVMASSIILVFLIWGVCGFLSSWSTLVLADTVEERKSKATAAYKKRYGQDPHKG